MQSHSVDRIVPLQLQKAKTVLVPEKQNSLDNRPVSTPSNRIFVDNHKMNMMHLKLFLFALAYNQALFVEADEPSFLRRRKAAATSACPEIELEYPNESDYDSLPIHVLSSDGNSVSFQIEHSFGASSGILDLYVGFAHGNEHTCMEFPSISEGQIVSETVTATCFHSNQYALVDVYLDGEGLPQEVISENFSNSACCDLRGPENAPKKLYTFVVPCVTGCTTEVSSTPGPTPEPTPAPEQIQRRAEWMSGQYGVGYRIPGGISIHTSTYNAAALADQLKQIPAISYLIVGLSSGAAGDRYIAPHPKFTELGMRAVTPKEIDVFEYGPTNDASRTVDMDTFPDLDLFDSILTEMDKIGVRVIAYMNVMGPPMLKHREESAFDYPISGGDYNSGGYFVNATAECVPYTGTEPCSPSVRKWVDWVAKSYTNEEEAIYPIGDGYDFDDTYVDGSPLNIALKDAYANVVVDYYAELYGDRIAGFWFDAGSYGDRSKIFSAVRRHNPNAAIAYNQGSKIPLRNNNAWTDGEDYTFGHITAHQSAKNPPDGCYNYGMVLSAESSINGYVYQDAQPINGAAFSSTDLGYTTTSPNPYIQPGFNISYIQDDYPSLAHIFMPARTMWNTGDLAWNPRQAAEWMQRTTDAGGAFTWNVARSFSIVNPDDWSFLQETFSLLPIVDEYQFDATNCDCLSEFGTAPALSWGCQYIPPADECKNLDISEWFYVHPNGKPKDCAWVCKGASSRCPDPNIVSQPEQGSIPAVDACKQCCKPECVAR